MDITAVFPGTFDPLTVGHMDIIKRGACLFDKLIVAVANSPSKHTLFNLDTRCELAKEALSEFRNVSVVPFSGMLVDFLKENNAKVLLRGIRSVHDYDYEAQLTGMYGALMPELEVVFLNTKANVSFISSTFVREIIIHKGDVTPFVPENISKYISSVS